jgi:protein-tyrosine-phosphatase
MMAELLQDELGNGFEVKSAGTQVSANGNFADSHAVSCMKKRGIDISSHRGRCIGNLKLDSFPFIICVNETIAGAVFGLLKKGADTRVFIADEGRGIPLFPGAGTHAYEECATLLERIIPGLAQTIRG